MLSLRILVSIAIVLAAVETGVIAQSESSIRSQIDSMTDLLTRMKALPDTTEAKDVIALATATGHRAAGEASLTDIPEEQSQAREIAREFMNLAFAKLDDTDPETRANALRTLAQDSIAIDATQKEQLRRAIFQSINHPDPKIRAAAVATLGHVIDDPNELSDRLRSLSQSEQDPMVISEVRRSLPELAANDALFLKILRESDVPEDIEVAVKKICYSTEALPVTELVAAFTRDVARVPVSQVLGNFLDISQLVDFVPYLADESSVIRTTVALVLESALADYMPYRPSNDVDGSDIEKKLASLLAQHLTSPDPFVRCSVLNCLTVIRANDASITVPPMSRFESPEVDEGERLAAAVALLTVKRDERAKDYLAQIITGGDLLRRELLREITVRQSHLLVELADSLDVALQSGRDDVRDYSLDLLLNSSDEPAVPCESLAKIASRSDLPEVQRLKAIRLLASCNVSESENTIELALQDPSSKVRLAAVESLREDLPKHRKLLLSILADPDLDVVRQALEKLRFFYTGNDAEAVISAADRLLSDDQSDAVAFHALATANPQHPKLLAAATQDQKSIWKNAIDAYSQMPWAEPEQPLPTQIQSDLQRRLASPIAQTRLDAIDRIKALGHRSQLIELLIPIVSADDPASCGAAMQVLTKAAQASGREVAMALSEHLDSDWPPPMWTLMKSFPAETFGSSTTKLSDAHKLLLRMLNDHGYRDRAVFEIPGGFAILVRPERFYPNDGRSFDEGERWTTHWVPTSRLRLSDFLLSVFQAPAGHFRFFLIAVSDESPKASIRPASYNAFDMKWRYDDGLPQKLGSQAADKCRCHVLIYHFLKKEGGRTEQVYDDNLSAETYLRGSGLLDDLQRQWPR